MANIVVDKYVYEVEIDASNPNAVPLGMGLMKGDILVYKGEGNLARLPVGSDGQVLTADSTSAFGVAWKTPAA